MIATTQPSLVTVLLAHGEDETATWVQGCGDEELAQVFALADWLARSAEVAVPPPLDRAFALAAVHVREGAPRDLARARRRRVPASALRDVGDRDLPAVAVGNRREAVDDAARAYWG